MVQGGKKSGLWKKKSKIAHTFFVTKATYPKTIFLKSPYEMDIETWYLFQNIFFHFTNPFLPFFLTLPSTQTFKVIKRYYFNVNISWIERIEPLRMNN